MWFFAEEEKVWKTDDFMGSNRGSIVWNKQSLLNALSSKVILNSEMSVTGWWMDHARWDVDIRCFNQKWAICSKGFSTSCKPDGIRAIYQYITFKREAQISGLELSLTATADQLESQVAGSTFGALAFVKLSDGSSENMKIQFPVNIDPLTPQSTTLSVHGNRSVISVIVMLMCYGYTGSVHFTDPVLLPQSSIHYTRQNAIMKCSPKSYTSHMPSHTMMKQEKLSKFHTQSTKEHHYLITLVTQVSMDRLSILERSLRFWEGPVSLVIYVPTKGVEGEDSEWQKIYVQKKLKSLNLSSQCHVTLVFGHSTEADYPINVLRNIAIRQANTKYILLVDADFQPSPNFQQRFATVLKHQAQSARTAFVIPAFEYIELPQKSDSVPQTKEELLQLLHREDPFILPFRMTESSESHRITDYWKWYRADKPYAISSFSDKYEPYVVLQRHNSLPLYDERFSGYGMNKVTHITELFAANFTFIVLPNVWVIHLPHKISSYTVEFLQNPQHRLKNRLERFEFMGDIMRKYRIGPCRNER